jgi:type II secretory pathway pseudopilin PulG
MKKLKDNPDAGFSLLEVVVAIVMIFFFTNVALQMLVLSSLFKKKATQYTTAISLIQQDMEKIKSAADQYSFPKVTGSGTGTLILENNNGLSSSDKVQFSNGSSTYNISGIPPTPSPTPTTSPTVTPSPTPSPSPTVSTFVFNNTSCNLTPLPTASPTPTPWPPNNSMAKYFQNSLPTTATGTAYTVNGTVYYRVSGTGVTNPTPLKGQYYWLLRKQDVSTNAPYNVLQLKYVVQPGLPSNPSTTPNTATAATLATSSTEVIPYASLQCPSQ